MTTKLYYKDQYLKSFSATVTEIVEFEGQTAIVLDESAFFPEGGGQTSDIGTINSLEVFDAQIKDGIIFHKIKSFDGSVSVGDTVQCEINWKKRFSDMQQHSGEHIFSGIIHNLFKLENVGFHLGSEAVTLDFGRVLTESELSKVEYLVNKAIWDNKKINCYFPSMEELEDIEYRSKKEITEDLRIVEIEDIDVCACCAPHVRTTGEIGIAKIIGTEKLRGGTRISILCGERAFLDIREKIIQNKAISVLLSEKEHETLSAVERVKKQKEQLEFELNEKKYEIIKMTLEKAERKTVQLEFCNFEGEFLRKYTTLLSEKADNYAVAFSGEDGNYRFVMIASEGFDITAPFSELKEKLSVKGGGRNGMIQGSILNSKDEIISAFSQC